MAGERDHPLPFGNIIIDIGLYCYNVAKIFTIRNRNEKERADMNHHAAKETQLCNNRSVS